MFDAMTIARVKWPKYPTRGNAVGHCNICATLGLLTDDHIPPKGVPKVSTMRMHQLFRVLGDGVVPPSGRQAQGGVQFRTLCTTCNSDQLGLRYDPELIQMATAVDRFLSALKAGMVVPSYTFVRLRPQRVLRSVVGHASFPATKKPSQKRKYLRRKRRRGRMEPK